MIPRGIDREHKSLANRITEVVFPSTLTEIGPKAFSGSSLRNVRVAKENPCFLAQRDVLLQRKEDGALLLLFAFGKSETVTVTEGVTEIGCLAFYRSAVKEVRPPPGSRRF